MEVTRCDFQNFSFYLMQWSVIEASHVSQHSTLHQGANELWHCLLPVVSQLLNISLVDTKQMKFCIGISSFLILSKNN